MAARRSNPQKTTAKTPVGALVEQPHGGALRNGGTNRGGPGRPPSAIRASARLAFDKRLPVLDRLAGGKRVKHADRIRAIDTLGKYGMGHPVSIDDVRERLRQQLDEIRELLPPEQSEQLIARLKSIWTDL